MSVILGPRQWRTAPCEQVAVHHPRLHLHRFTQLGEHLEGFHTGMPVDRGVLLYPPRAPNAVADLPNRTVGGHEHVDIAVRVAPAAAPGNAPS